VTRAFFQGLAKDAAVRYKPAGRFAYHFAFSKLTRDPAFAHIVLNGLLVPARRILDLGCGQGLLAALILAARDHRDAWPSDLPLPPDPVAYQGVDVHGRDIERARRAVDGIARFECADIRSTAFGEADTVVLLDVLHYFNFHTQNDLLRRARTALDGVGTVLLRVADESPSLRHRCSMGIDRTVMALRRQRIHRLHCRPLSAWIRTLEALDFDVTATPLPSGVPFTNVLIVARYDSRRRNEAHPHLGIHDDELSRPRPCAHARGFS